MARQRRASEIVEDIKEIPTLEVEDIDIEQGDLFPELNKSDPKHKVALKCAKNYYATKTKRDELLSTSKEEMDNAREALVIAMKSLGFPKFRSNGVKCVLIPGRDKVRVTAEDDSEDSEEEED